MLSYFTQARYAFLMLLYQYPIFISELCFSLVIIPTFFSVTPPTFLVLTFSHELQLLFIIYLITTFISIWVTIFTLITSFAFVSLWLPSTTSSLPNPQFSFSTLITFSDLTKSALLITFSSTIIIVFISLSFIFLLLIISTF